MLSIVSVHVSGKVITLNNIWLLGVSYVLVIGLIAVGPIRSFIHLFVHLFQVYLVPSVYEKLFQSLGVQREHGSKGLCPNKVHSPGKRTENTK